MVNPYHVAFNATDRSYLAILKREIHLLVGQLKFSTKRAGEIDIIVAEMGSNLVKHAGGGEILVRILKEPEPEGIELISIDNGPGMADPGRMMTDGVSTSQTLGHGLGAIKRLSDVFNLYSTPEWGTVLLARIFKKPPARGALNPRAEVRSVIVPKPGETVSGDGFSSQLSTETLRLFLGDGLGHGPEAGEAVRQAAVSFQESRETQPVEIIRQMHRAVRKTRGLVGTVAAFDFSTRKCRLCGVGNITTRFHLGPHSRNYLSYNGIIGLNVPGTMNDQELTFESGHVMIMCSDGIKSRWDISRYPSILKYDLSVLAAALYKDYARRTDDTSVVIARFS
ncbi:ATP-binding SpoIIE family protein phosphatase [Larkinella soli]|uniref:ATP-binding SpoIIE family protein phosphatase n=1 Tax=Larkinella soli TaxID=1770527 RepID=UPI000FFC4AFB|nr:ATP-binding SpoIIE family protein phosphatase [Larkinella soli]